jgi:Zn-finger nucleic acid-binding protein
MGLFSRFFHRDTAEKALRCPRDQAELERDDLDDITLYACNRCDGHWLPSAQAPQFFKRMNDPEKALREFQLQVEQHSQPSAARCARDGAAMRYFTQRGVTLDVCPQCRSIWFDGDELRQFLARPPEEVPAEQAKPDLIAGAAATVAVVEVAAGLFDLFD